MQEHERAVELLKRPLKFSMGMTYNPTATEARKEAYRQDAEALTYALRVLEAYPKLVEALTEYVERQEAESRSPTDLVGLPEYERACAVLDKVRQATHEAKGREYE